MYSGLLKARLGRGRIGSLSLTEVVDGVVSRISYGGLEIRDFHDGKTGLIATGPVHLNAPSPDGPVDITIGGMEGRDMDLAPLIRVYDPAAYGPGGVGDMVWHVIIPNVTYDKIAMNVPGEKVVIGRVSMDGLKVRQPKHSFAALLDATMAHPNSASQEMNDAAREGLVDFLSAFSIGRFGVSDVALDGNGINKLELGDFHIADLSIEGLGELGIEGLVGAVEGQGAMSIARFTFGGMTFPDAGVLRKALRSAAGGGGNPFDQTALVPKLGFIEANGIQVQTRDVPDASLAKMRVDLSDYVGYLPTKVSAAIDGLEMPVETLDPQARETMSRLGYDRVSLDYGLKYRWDGGKEQLVIDDIHIRSAGMGGISGSAVIGGVKRVLVEHPDSADAEAVQDLSLVSGKVILSDESIVGKGLGLLAETFKAPPDEFRHQFADALPGLLTMSGSSDQPFLAALRQSGLLEKLTPAVKTFVAEPFGSLTLAVSPTQPVSLIALAQTAETAPADLIEALNLSVSAEPGTATPAKKTETTSAPK
jgi:hypothetical protein